MVKHTETIHRLLPTNCFSVFDHFVGLALRGLKILFLKSTKQNKSKWIFIIKNLIVFDLRSFWESLGYFREPLNIENYKKIVVFSKSVPNN